MAASKKRRAIFRFFFVLYLVALCYMLFVSERVGADRTQYRYNIILFKEIKRFAYNIDSLGYKAVIINLLGNVVAFAPFGYFVPKVFDRRRGLIRTTFLCFLFSLAVESIQLITMLGCFDVDDLLLNTVGGFLGFIIYAIQERLKKC